ncbi:MAG: head-tail connector protein [Lachnospiraceae bacterium]|nr:head-tail connector protein [Lachnospiraceae bacterium]
MKVSEITIADVADYIREDEPDEKLLTAILTAAKEYVCKYTGLSPEQVDSHEDFWLAVMCLCQDMYDTRSMYVERGNTNRVVESILAMHAVNYL